MLRIRPSTWLPVVALLLPLLAAPLRALALEPEVIAQVQQMAQVAATAGAPKTARVAVEVGQLSPQLKLAPCRQVQPYLPPGMHMWGRSRIGLRCVDGMAKWNVSVPVQVRVFARALVAAQPLPAGTVIAQDSLASAEIDIAGETGSVFTDAEDVTGRTLARPLQAGQALRSTALSRRQFFAAGEMVRVTVAGPGYAIAAEGQAMAPGLEGQDVRIRMDNGRTVLGRVTGERHVEVML